MYLMDIYGLRDVSNNESVACLWTGVIVGSIVIPHIFLSITRSTKWVPFAMSVVAFIVSLCITLIPCWMIDRRGFGVALILLGATAGSCRSYVYPLYLDRFGVMTSCFALSLTTSLAVLSGRWQGRCPCCCISLDASV